MAKKWPGMVIQRSFIKGHSFRNSLYFINSAIVALKGYIWLQCRENEKKSPDGVVVQKYQKQILKQGYLHYFCAPVPGVSKNLEDQTEDHSGKLSSKIQLKLNET